MCKQKETPPKQLQSGKTLLELINEVLPPDDSIVEIDPNGELIPEFAIEDSLIELSSRIGTNTDEAKIFAIIFSAHIDGGEIYEKDIAKLLKITLRKYDYLHKNLQSLYEKGLILKSNSYRSRVIYFVGLDIQKSIFKNQNLDNANLKTDVFGLADNAIRYFKMYNENLIDNGMLTVYLNKLLEINSTLPLAKTIKKLRLPKDEMILLFALYSNTIEGEASFNYPMLLSSLYSNNIDRINITRKLQNGHARLLTSGITKLEAANFRVANVISLTEKGLDAVFGKEKALLNLTPSDSAFHGLILAHNISERKLFYNNSEADAINRLIKVLGDKQFTEIQKKLFEENMSPGMAILLYGSPGTGKTESVYQAARMTGRDLFKVDISTIRDKYVGESEKMISKIFDDYRRCMKRPGPVPILFLNEADAIIGKRIQVGNSVDQMNNTMQNILLEELEQFQGIMFCTTNLETNLDVAFERRFLYKIKFNSPETEVRAAIMRERISLLTPEQALELSNRYKLSGGQIDNIHRKLISERLLNGNEASFEYIEKICAEESVLQKNGHKSIGGFLNRVNNL